LGNPYEVPGHHYGETWVPLGAERSGTEEVLHFIALYHPTSSTLSTHFLFTSKPKKLLGVALPFGYFDPFELAPTDESDFKKYRESELKHGRIGMIAFLGLVLGEAGPSFFGDEIMGPAIFQYQQAEATFPAWSFNVVGLALAVEGFNIVKGWQSVGETMKASVGVAALKDVRKYCCYYVCHRRIGDRKYEAVVAIKMRECSINAA
jgi:hypothetical protein